MKKIFLSLLIIPVIGIAQIPPGYYNSAAGLSGNPLKVALYNIIKNHTQISYSNLWNAYPKTDKKANGKVWDIYSDVPGGTSPYEYTFITDQCGSYNSEGDCYNREHSWPQSWFNSVTGPVSDMFHIYPTDGKVNGERSNYPYGNVSIASWTSLNGGKLGACSNLGYTNIVFEPIDEYKGDLARGYFYMSTRYYSEDASWSSSDATNKATILPWQVNVLLQWHYLDPVSAKEIARNDSIYYLYQHNRNPYIDNPQWVDSIWHQDVTVFINEMSLTNSYSIYPNPSQNEFRIVNHDQNKQDPCYMKIYCITGELIRDEEILFEDNFSIDCSEWARGVYFVSIKNENSSAHFKLIKE